VKNGRLRDLLMEDFRETRGEVDKECVEQEKKMKG